MPKRFCLSFIIIVFAFTTVLAADEETLGIKAEKEGEPREALAYYVKALQAAPD